MSRRSRFDAKLLSIVFSLALVSCGKSGNRAASPGGVEAAPSGAVGGTRAPNPAAMTSAAISAIGAPLRPNGVTAENPDAETIALIYFSMAGEAPPYDDWAHQEFQYVQNEFERTKKTDAALAAFKSKSAFAGTVGHITLPMQSQLSEYDEKGGDFYIAAFSPSSSWSFPYKGGTYKISFTNGDVAQHWKLAASDAERAIERNGGNHNVTVTANLDLVGTQPAADGGTITAVVSSYSIESANRREPLGVVKVSSK